MTFGDLAAAGHECRRMLQKDLTCGSAGFVPADDPAAAVVRPGLRFLSLASLLTMTAMSCNTQNQHAPGLFENQGSKAEKIKQKRQKTIPWQLLF